jgi:hypothetical protein
MQTSRLYLGEPVDVEAALRADSPCNLGELHWLAQRVCQYARSASADRERLSKLLPRIDKRVGRHFLGQLTLAVAHRVLGNSAQADDAWAFARELAPSGHPWTRVVPDHARWTGSIPPPQLVEEEPGRVYRLVGETRPPGAAFGTLGVGRFIRLSSRALIFLNPVPVPEHVAAQVRALGQLQHIIAPAKYHSEHVMAARRAFPDAQAWGVPAHRGYAKVAGVAFDGLLDDNNPLFPEELDQVTLHGNDVGDVWLLDRASSTLITTDALFYSEAPASSDYSTAFSSFYAWAWGVSGRNGVPSYQPPMWRDLPRYQEVLRRAFGLGFEHVAYCHGSWRAIENNGAKRLEDALRWITQLSRLDGARLTLDFVRRHPLVVYRALRDGGA